MGRAHVKSSCGDSRLGCPAERSSALPRMARYLQSHRLVKPYPFCIRLVVKAWFVSGHRFSDAEIATE